MLAVQSHVVHGYVGNRAATFPLQILGIEVDAINSVQFSNHTGYPHLPGQLLQGDELLELVHGLELNSLLPGSAAWPGPGPVCSQPGSYSHLLTGYIGAPSFLQALLQVHAKLREGNPRLVDVCDPVMGDLLDDGREKLYVPEELVRIYRERVVPIADLIKPTQFECELLAEARARLPLGLSAAR